MLAPTDYEITEAENGEQALAAIAKQRPDLILMDIQLPIMDGYTATTRIKADPALRSIPIIAVTSYVLSGEEKKARAAGCDDYVPKLSASANCCRKFVSTYLNRFVALHMSAFGTKRTFAAVQCNVRFRGSHQAQARSDCSRTSKTRRHHLRRRS